MSDMSSTDKKRDSYTKDISLKLKKALKKEGWVQATDSFNLVDMFNAFIEEPNDFLKSTGHFLAKVIEHNSDKNILGQLAYFFSEELELAREEYINSLSSPLIDNKDRFSNVFLRGIDHPSRFSLELYLIKAILLLLGKPKLIVKKEWSNYSFYTYPVSSFTVVEELPLKEDGDNYIVYEYENEEISLRYECIVMEYNEDHVTVFSYDLRTRDKNTLLNLINKVCVGLAEIRMSSHKIVGEFKAAYLVKDFPDFIQESAIDIMEDIYATNDKYSVLFKGLPGTGKTALANAIAKEYLSPLGYFIFVLEPNELVKFYPPYYLDKICIIVNEVDNLVLDRSKKDTDGKAESILSFFDGTLYKTVEPDKLASSPRIITFMTANTTDRLDPAFLRKGRIDKVVECNHLFV